MNFPMLETLQPHLDPLTHFELRVAKRADELAAAGSIKTSLNLMCWLQAEYELLSEMGLPTRTHGSAAASSLGSFADFKKAAISA
jgi:hypothetical protein